MRLMANIATLLKSEISRVARKQVRVEIPNLKKAAAAQRAELGALKRRVQALEIELRRLLRSSAKASRAQGDEADKAPSPSLRFSAKGLASQRQRLELSAEDCGLLLGTSGQSVYNWEAGKARPRARYLPAIAALRAMGKKAAAAQLAALRQAA
jgi:DNA-binding transcriptional regulator YiaG